MSAINKFNNSIQQILNEEYNNEKEMHHKEYMHHHLSKNKALKKAEHYDLNASLHKNNKNPSLNHQSHLKNLAQKYKEIADLHDKAMDWHKEEYNKLESDKRHHLN